MRSRVAFVAREEYHASTLGLNRNSARYICEVIAPSWCSFSVDPTVRPVLEIQDRRVCWLTYLVARQESRDRPTTAQSPREGGFVGVGGQSNFGFLLKPIKHDADA